MKYTIEKSSCCSTSMRALMELAVPHMRSLPSRMSHAASSGPFINVKRKGSPTAIDTSRNRIAPRWANESVAPL